ncbi:hypothetical protein B0A50_04308 [Salinomyces thailandicus]|uniref:Uncharacterized protein n=1 Tax=Salinomyces thailandicus TaxID=706561 RepID=A0A4U0TXT2_9PEZI|nr:hypothetical protein B0A50_04308 [Salinomyces thailandica]
MTNICAPLLASVWTFKVNADTMLTPAWWVPLSWLPLSPEATEIEFSDHPTYHTKHEVDDSYPNSGQDCSFAEGDAHNKKLTSSSDDFVSMYQNAEDNTDSIFDHCAFESILTIDTLHANLSMYRGVAAYAAGLGRHHACLNASLDVDISMQEHVRFWQLF